MDYRDDDIRGRGYCPRCGREMTLDVALFGYCEDHGRQPADFTRPTCQYPECECASADVCEVTGEPNTRRRNDGTQDDE